MNPNLIELKNIEKNEYKKMIEAALVRKQELYELLSEHYDNLALLYAFASGKKVLLKRKKKYIRKKEDDFCLLHTVFNFRNQIFRLEKELGKLIKTVYSSSSGASWR
jgi:hypothetical protein